MFIAERLKQIEQFLNDHFDEFWDDLESLVNLEARHDEVRSLWNVATHLQQKFEEAGVNCDLIDMGEHAGPILVGTRVGRSEKPILFSGHYDTVFQTGELGVHPFRIEGNKVFGPGVLDMKGGICMALWIIKALDHIGFDEVPIKILFVGDEEVAHHKAKTATFLQDFATNCLFAFNMETGKEDGSVCIGRKGSSRFTLITHGRASHSGNAYRMGINAIEEMAYKIIAIQKLTPDDCRYTISANVISGGTGKNIIPACCSCTIDVRHHTQEELNTVILLLEGICAQVHVEGTTSELQHNSQMPSFETRESITTLYRFLCDVSKQYAPYVPGSFISGGASDASHIETAGTAVLCSCGMCGSANHTHEEYALTNMVIPKSLVLCSAVLSHASLQQSI